MRKILFLFLFAIVSANASITDFIYLKKAKEAYESGNYEKAAKYYEKTDNRSDEVKFNMADAYYKSKNYKKALKLYESIKDKKLEFKKLHNLGNTYAHLNRIDEAIKAYEKALKIKEDKDTRFNLELLKKLKQKKKKENKKQNNKQNNKQNKQNNKQNSKQNKQNNKQNDKQNEQNKKKNENKKSSDKNSDKNGEKDKKKKEKNSEKKHEKTEKGKREPKPSFGKKEPISDMEIRKYDKLLNQRGINTLMLPLNTKGEKEDEKREIKPW